MPKSNKALHLSAAMAFSCLFMSVPAHAYKWEKQNWTTYYGHASMYSCMAYSFPYPPERERIQCYNDVNPVDSGQFEVFESVSGVQASEFSQVAFFEKENYQGVSFALSSLMPGRNVNLIPYNGPGGGTWAGRIRSIKVAKGLSVRICDGANKSGNCIVFRGDKSPLNAGKVDLTGRVAYIEVFFDYGR